MDTVPRPEDTHKPISGPRIGVVAALLVVLALGAGLAVFLVTRPDAPAGPGVANVGPTPTTIPSSQGTSSQGDRVAYSSCMRAHGLPDFPDPDSNGSIKVVHRAGSTSDLDPNSPRFQAAQKACEKLAPNGNMTPAQQAQARSAALKFSACMRAHGLPDFPDPDSKGGFDIQVNQGSDLDASSPRFQAAQNACQSLRLDGGSKGAL